MLYKKIIFFLTFVISFNSFKCLAMNSDQLSKLIKDNTLEKIKEVMPQLSENAQDFSLYLAVKYYKPLVVEYLISLNANPNILFNQGWNTALMLAAGEAFLDIVDLLLKSNKTDVNIKNKEGSTALDRVLSACYFDRVKMNNDEYNKRISIAKLLIAHRINVNSRMFFVTPLIRAIKGNFTEIIDDIIKAGADLNAQEHASGIISGTPITGFLGNTALIYAVINNRTAVVKKLLEEKANPNIREVHMDYNALDYAVQANNKTIVEMLISTGNVDLNSKNSVTQKTAQVYAKFLKHVEIERLIQEAVTAREKRIEEFKNCMSFLPLPILNLVAEYINNN